MGGGIKIKLLTRVSAVSTEDCGGKRDSLRKRTSALNLLPFAIMCPVFVVPARASLFYCTPRENWCVLNLKHSRDIYEEKLQHMTSLLEAYQMSVQEKDQKNELLSQQIAQLHQQLRQKSSDIATMKFELSSQ